MARYREASENPSPAVQGSGMPLALELKSAVGAVAGVDEKHETAMRLIKHRSKEVTMTRLLLEKDPVTKHYLNDALLGLRFNKELEIPQQKAPPVHLGIQLQSLKTRCPGCEDDSCGRAGKYHDIVYKSDIKARSARELNQMALEGEGADVTIRCAVDPETGLFLEPLAPLEAKKCLTQYGERVVYPRWKDRQNQKGDRWLVREPAHHEMFIAGKPAHVRDEPLTTVD